MRLHRKIYVDSDDSEADSDISDDNGDNESEKVVKVHVTDGPSNRKVKPKHQFGNEEAIIENLRSDIKKYHEEQMLFLEKEFKEIKSKLDSFLASGLARSLVPLLPSSLNQTDKHTPAISSQEVSMAPMSPATSLDTMPPDMPESDATTVMPTPVVSNTVTSHSINPTSGSTSTALTSLEELSAVSDVGAEVDVSNNELMPHSNIVKLFTKAKNRNQFAAFLVADLIDEETRVRSNVNGHKKEMLDPTIIAWVKKKCFEFHPTEGNLESEWKCCINAIDTKNRGMKRRKSFKS